MRGAFLLGKAMFLTAFTVLCGNRWDIIGQKVSGLIDVILITIRSFLISIQSDCDVSNRIYPIHII